MTAFLLVHGAWHNSETWDEVAAQLRAKGHLVRAIDLPGAGDNARLPASFGVRPLDPAAFGAEPSPNAGVTQEERTTATIEAVRALNAETGGKVVLVGHSLGGITVSPVAETIPDELSAAVYVTAYLLPPGMPAIAMIQHPSMVEAIVPTLLMADPKQIGALRIDTGTQDAEYRARLKECFYGDVDDATFDRLATSFHCDEPMGVCVVPSPITAANFGRVPRHYVHCAQDRAITASGQQEMVRLTDEAMGNATVVHRLNSSHSPFNSMPDKLTALLDSIGG